MRKNRMKMKALLLACCVALTGIVSDNCIVQAENICTDADTAQRAANKAYQDLNALRSKDESIQKVYAGAYIDDDNVLVVNLTTSSEEIKDKIQASIKPLYRFGDYRISYPDWLPL